jgi:hypothetical protein
MITLALVLVGIAWIFLCSTVHEIAALTGADRRPGIVFCLILSFCVGSLAIFLMIIGVNHL